MMPNKDLKNSSYDKGQLQVSVILSKKSIMNKDAGD